MKWENNEIYCAAFGGFLIALSSTIHLYTLGRVTGMSGIFRSIATFEKNAFQRNFMIFLGLIVSSGFLFNIYKFEKSQLLQISFFDKPQDFQMGSLTLLISGLLVGMGSKLQNGCTSGHGVCGLPRFNLRSWVSVPIFLLVSILVQNFLATYPVIENLTKQEFLENIKNLDILQTNNISKYMIMIGTLPFSIFLTGAIINKSKRQIYIENIISYIVGIIFGLGLCISGMTKQSKIQGFLRIDQNWDPSLLFVLGVSVLINLVTFNLIIKKGNALMGQKIRFNKSKVDSKLIFGAILFGIGWGLGSLCPGPAMTLIPIFQPFNSIMWLTGMFIGHILLT